MRTSSLANAGIFSGLYIAVYIGASGKASCIARTTFSAPPIVVKKSQTIAIRGCLIGSIIGYRYAFGIYSMCYWSVFDYRCA